VKEKRRILDSMGGESANHRRFCGPENRLLRDAEEQLKTFAPYGLRTQCGCRLAEAAHSHAARYAGRGRCVSSGGQDQSFTNDLGARERLL
jgi:hypothetical protein